MTSKYFQIEEVFTRKIWKKLRYNQVPIVTEDAYKNLSEVVSKTNKDLRSKAYFPSIGHGYLGLEKGNGVTRFLPILSDVDMAVYYHICFTLSDRILKKRHRVFGGWHLVPKSQRQSGLDLDDGDGDEEAKSFLQDYFSDPFSSSLWLQEWRKFTDLIGELCKENGIGNYVIQTDVANFYDSIEIPRLIKNLRIDANEFEEHIEVLELFLSYWNRRLNSYQSSTKGIPQEIISDASRVLSHYYLQQFDEDFSAYCEANKLINIRWADDILIFGKSPKSLEQAVHKASKTLLKYGLNLNASKTKIFSRKEFSKFRAVDLLAAIGANNEKLFRKKLGSSIRYYANNDMRMDTVFKASIGYIKKLGDRAQMFEKSFVLETAKSNTNLLLSVNARQMMNLISISDDSLDFFNFVQRKIVSAPYAAPRAMFLQLLRKHHQELIGNGVSKKRQLYAAKFISSHSSDSEIIIELCVPPTISAIE